MSSQDDLNNDYVNYILYYCGVIMGDTRVHDTGLVDVCTAYYNSLLGTLTIEDWKTAELGYPVPTFAMLLSYDKNTVDNWFNWFYTKPVEIKQTQFYIINAANLSNVRTDPSMIGYSVLDSSSRKVKTFNGTAWVDSTFNLVPTVQTLEIGTSSSASLPMTANVARMVDVPDFKADVFTSDFKFDPLTGKATYIGAAARMADVVVQYTTTKNLPVTLQSLYTWVALNGSLVPPAKKSREVFQPLSIALADTHCITRSLMLSPGDTVQLATSYTATSSGIIFSDVGVGIKMR